MSYCSALSFGAKLTKIEEVLCLGTMRGRGHSILLNENQAKIVKALTLCPKMPLGLLGTLHRSKGGFETMVSD